ncbi:hypothetical protein BgiMline_014884 [Biomphalaria glabrata]|nr:RNA-binding protein 25-like; partial [Biomphalaria glabrata]
MIKKELHRQPTLPHVLTEYGFQDLEAERLQKAKEKEKERRKAVKKHDESNFDDYERERTLEKEKERDEQCLQLVKDIYKLRDYYYKEYNALLAAKVEKQREQIKANDAARSKLREEQEEKERQETHKVKKRLRRHTLDQKLPTFYVPKTDLYYIVGLEEKLRREGKLKTVMDYNKFRKEISEPETFYKHFKVQKHLDQTKYTSSLNEHQSSYSCGESSDSLYSLEPKVKHDDRPLGRISESQESTRSDNWAVTQMYHSQSKQTKSGSGVSSKADDIEKKFPKLDMPKLHCFTMDLNRKLPDPEEVRVDKDLKAKELHRKRMARTVTKMYQLAMSNAAVSARIMDQHEDLKMFLEGPSLSDVIADRHWLVAYGMNDLKEETPESSCPSPAPTQSRLQPIQEAESSRDTSVQDVEECPGSQEMSTVPDEKKSLVPLTMEEIRTNCTIKESKALSTLWHNYVQTGK